MSVVTRAINRIQLFRDTGEFADLDFRISAEYKFHWKVRWKHAFSHNVKSNALRILQMYETYLKTKIGASILL